MLINILTGARNGSEGFVCFGPSESCASTRNISPIRYQQHAITVTVTVRISARTVQDPLPQHATWYFVPMPRIARQLEKANGWCGR